jgi:hypothetical protein
VDVGVGAYHHRLGKFLSAVIASSNMCLRQTCHKSARWMERNFVLARRGSTQGHCVRHFDEAGTAIEDRQAQFVRLRFLVFRGAAKKQPHVIICMTARGFCAQRDDWGSTENWVAGSAAQWRDGLKQ